MSQCELEALHGGRLRDVEVLHDRLGRFAVDHPVLAFAVRRIRGVLVDRDVLSRLLEELLLTVAGEQTLRIVGRLTVRTVRTRVHLAALFAVRGCGVVRGGLLLELALHFAQPDRSEVILLLEQILFVRVTHQVLPQLLHEALLVL